MLNHTCQSSDVVEMQLEMPVREVVSHPQVEDNRGKVAFERGPIVFCAEGVDHNGEVLSLQIKDKPRFDSTGLPDLNVPLLKGTALRTNTTIPLRLIPYYAWSHRGTGEMTVWFPVQ